MSSSGLGGASRFLDIVCWELIKKFYSERVASWQTAITARVLVPTVAVAMQSHGGSGEVASKVSPDSE